MTTMEVDILKATTDGTKLRKATSFRRIGLLWRRRVLKSDEDDDEEDHVEEEAEIVVVETAESAEDSTLF